jgi:hypothetical protein
MLKEIDQFVYGHFDVAQYGAQQARAQRFAGVYRDCGRSAIRVFQKNMAAARPIHNEAAFFESTNYLSSLGTGEPSHTEIC